MTVLDRKPREFLCDGCRRNFWSWATREELVAEFQQKFPGETAYEPGILCDDCWDSFSLGLRPRE